MSLIPSNYRVHNNTETCIGDGLCVKRCPMGAIHLEDSPGAKNRISKMPAKNKSSVVELKNKTGKVAVVDPDLCIGCGVCAYKCPTKSLILKSREVIRITPKDQQERIKLAVAELAAARAQQGQKSD